MKKVKNGVTKNLALGSEKPMTYAEVCIFMIMNFPEKEGVTKAIMKQDLEIVKKIEEASEIEIILEDAQYNRLKSISDRFPWAIKNIEILDVTDAIDGADDYKMEPVKSDEKGDNP